MLSTTDINTVFTDKHGVHKMFSNIIIILIINSLGTLNNFETFYLIYFNILILIIREMTNHTFSVESFISNEYHLVNRYISEVNFKCA